jgi:adenine-specific DNA-methyltransferase
MLMDLTRHELGAYAEFPTDSSFRLHDCPFAGNVPPGLYELPRRSGDAHLYRLSHPLAEAVVRLAKSRELGSCTISFDYGAHEGKVSVLEPFVGSSGWLSLSALSVEALDQTEEHLLFAAVTREGQSLDDDVCRRLFTLPGRAEGSVDGNRPPELERLTSERRSVIERSISERNARFFEAEAGKLDAWADDMKSGLEREIKDLDRRIREARRSATTAGTLEEKLSGQKQVRALESERNQRRRSLFDAQDDLEHRRDELIASVEARLRQAVDLRELFVVQWKLS